MNEYAGERRLIKALNDGGFWARHIDCSIPGFSDILAIRGNNAFLLEMKDIDRREDKLRDILELTQAQFYTELETRANFTQAMLIFASARKNYYEMYRLKNIVAILLNNRNAKIDSLTLEGFGNTDSILYALRGIRRRGVCLDSMA